jgi:hypothetical protein
MADNRVRLYGRNGPGLTRNFTYNSSSNNNSNSEHNREGFRRRALDMNDIIHELYGRGTPTSPGRKPKAVNVSKYQKMLNNLENKNKNKNKNNNNNSNSNSNKNVVSWLNSNMTESKKNKIPKNKRVFLLTDLTKNGKIKQVWDRRFLNGLIESAETLPVSRRREVRKNNDPFFTSPLTRNKFSKNDIKAYPPTDATKKIIKRIMNGRVLEAKVNKIMKIKNKDYLARSNIFETIKRGIRKGDITTEKQIEELALIYRVTGKEILMSGHKKSDNYYKAYVDGNFKPHHIKFMKNAPTVISELYGPFITKNNAPGTVPLYKLPSEATKYLSQFEKYVSGKEPANWKNSFPIDARRPFFVDVLRQVVRNGHVYYLKSDTMNEINTFKNANLRNKLREYYNWHDIVMHASS